MATKTYVKNLHCDNCNNGIVVVKEKHSGKIITLSFSNCNSCKKPFGLFSASDLKPVVNEIKKVEECND